MLHSFKFNYDKTEYFFLWEAESGSLYSVDFATFLVVKNNNSTLSAEELALYNALPPETIAEISSEVASTDVKTPEKPTSLKKSNGEIKAMCLHICHDCNMRCAYCFAKDGTYSTEKDYMSARVGKKAIDFLIEKSGNRKNLEIDFFGGEPLINFDVVKEIVEYARSIEKQNGKTFKFTLTTNALILDNDASEYLNREMDNLVISIDGRRDVHNACRKCAGGADSYDAIIENAKNFRSIRGNKKYYVRGTFTNKNLDFSKDVQAIRDAGFDQISLEPVVLEAGHSLEIREEHLPIICEEYEKLARFCLDSRKSEKTWFNYFHYMIDLENSPCVKKRAVGCGAGAEYVAVTPVGDIFPCHQFAQDADYRMGNIFDGTFDVGIQDKFSMCNLYSKEGCAECFAKYYCSGGCVANSVHFAGDMNKPYKISCAMMQKRLEMALAIYAIEKEIKN